MGGFVFVNVTDLDSGSYSAQITYGGDAKYLPSSTEVSFVIPLKEVALEVSAADVAVGENVTVVIHTSAGSVEVRIDGKVYVVDIVDGVGVLTVGNFESGTHNVTVVFNGDSTHAAVMNYTSFNVFKLNSTVTAEYDGGLLITVPDDATGNVTVFVDGVESSYPVMDGFVFVNVTDLAPGNYSAQITYGGDAKYLSSTAQISFSVIRNSKSDAPIYVEASNVVYGEPAVINIELPENASGSVSVSVGNMSCFADVINGKATVIISNLDVGNYTAVVSYNGDESYNRNSTYVSFAVSDIEYLFDVADITVGDDATVYVHTSPAVTSNITVSIDNTYDRLISIADGQGSLILQGLKAGNHIIKYNSQVIPFNVNKKQTDMEINFTNIFYGQDMIIDISMPDDAKGDVFMRLNGNHTVSLSDGVAQFTIAGLEVGNYTVEIFYYNDEIYESVSQNITFSVLAPEEPFTFDFTVENITYGDNAEISITSSQNITETVNVTLCIVPQNVNSTSIPKTYTVDLTNGKGMLIIPNLNAENYSVNVKGIQKTFTVAPKQVTLTVDSIVYGEEIVTLNLNDDLEGEIIITVAGVNYTAVIENKKATFNASGLDADNYTLNAVYIGNNNYCLKETTYQFNIGKVNATFNLTADSITYSNDETIEIDVGPGITGKVYIDIGNYSFYTYVNNRKAIFNVTGVDAGNYVATLRYEGNNNTYSNRVIYNITVKQADVNMSVHVGNLTYSKNNTIAVNVPEGLSGNITIIIGNRHYTQVIDNRIIIFHIDNFNAGNYLVTAIYEGNNNYYNKTVLYNITIEKMTVDFTADVREVSYKEQNALRVNVPEGVTGNVTVIIGNYTYDTVILDGVIEYYITNINAGNHEVRIIYRGNDNYYYNETVFNITVKKLDVDITLEQDKITYSKNNSFTLNIPEGVDGNINVRIGNDTYNTVICNGTATVNLLNIKAGNYLFEAVYAGNNNYNNVTRFFNITIEKMHVGIELGVGSVSYNKNQTLNLIFPEEATGNVSIRIGNTTIRTTVVNGNATFNVVGINAGNYRAEVRYEGNDYYNEETTFVNINIEKVDVGITLETPTISYNDEKELTIDMSDVATGNVTVEIEGKKFTSIINKGKASFSIMGVSAGIYTVKVTYAGDVNYNSAEAIFNLTVTKLNALLNVSYDDENIIVALPEDATGDVVAVIANNSYTGTVENGSANIVVNNLLPGDYTATISYMGDANYNNGVVNVTFTVARISAPITVEADNIAEGEVAVINVALPENALGTVIVKVAGKSYTVTVKDGKASVEISGLSAGNYTVSAEYSGSEIYLSCSNTTLLSVSKTFVEAGIDVTVCDVAAGEDAVIAVTLPEDAEGTVTVAINNKEYTADVVNGKATVNLTGFNVGTYNATVSYSGDAKYLPDSKQVSFEVTKADILFNVSAEDVEFGEAVVIKATFPSDATGRAVLSIAGNTLTATIRNGVATFTTSGLLPDTYTATVTYNGNAKYDKTVQTAEFTVFKLEPVIDISAADIECGQDANIIVTLPDDATGYVSIIVAGKEYSAEIIDGIAELTVPSLKAGEYNVSAGYDGDEIYTLSNAGAVFKVSKINVTIDIIVNDVSAGENSKISIVLPDDATGGFHYSAGGSTGYMSNFEGGEYVIEAVYGQAGTVSVKATYDGNDKYLPGEAETSFTVRALPVSMKITAEPVYAGETATITLTLPEDAVGSIAVSYPGGYRGSNINNGKYSFTTQFAAAGNYTISASFKSSGKYESVENSTVLVVSVKPAEPAMEITATDVKEGSDEVISVALPRDATGEVTLEVNGVKYTAAVENGQATFTLSNLGEGDYNATVTYAGDVKYAQAVKTASFTVKKDTIGTVIVMESKFTRYATDYSGGERGGEFSATLYDVDKNPLAGKDVQITVNGVIYNVTSDENGKVGLDVNLAAANTYTYALLFYGDEDYKASPIASSKLTVIKKPTSIIANDMAFKTSAKTKTVIVALNTIKNPFDGKMYLKEGKKLELKVDGKTYTAKTGKDGVAKFNIKISKKGKYTATVSFEGSVTYESATKKIKITVSKSPSKNKELKGVGSGMDPKDLDTDEKMNIEGNYSEYLENGNFSTSEISTDKKDAFIDVESKFTRLATDYGADERGGFFYARLIDSDGNPIVGKTVQISVNGPVYDVVTDSQGRAGLQVNLAAANTYTYALSFSGDDEYNPALIASSKLTVTKKTTFITAKSVSFKAKAKTKTVSVSLKTVNNPFDGKMYLKTGKKLTLKVNGKTYTAKINKNHVAKFNIKLTKKGKYTAKISFDGDATYEACSNSIKINIK